MSKSEIRLWYQYHDHPIFKKTSQLGNEMFDNVVDFKNPGAYLQERSRIARYYSALNPEYLDIITSELVMEQPFVSY